jgi:hypothetical protein
MFALTEIIEQPSEARGRAQLPALGALTLSDLDRPLEARMRLSHV